jgi:hypothetical protein
MRLRTLAVCLLFAGACSAKEHDYQEGILVHMDSSSCGVPEKGSKTVTSVDVGGGTRQKQSRGLVCQEYVLQSDHMIFRIRQKDQKHPVVLPIGEIAQFRIGKQKLMVRVPEMSDKEHAYIVVSFFPREDNPSAAIQKPAQREVASESASKN